ncbi:MAG: GAF domain-containing protein [Phycisphaerales bacterium]|jgi:hypothetical protein
MVDRLARCSLTLLLAACVIASVGCSSKPEVLPRDAFWANLTQLCGKAYPGRVVEDSTNSPIFRDRLLMLQVAECDESSVAMPLLIEGRPWATLVIRNEEESLDLEHLHEPGTDGQSPPSGYGGPTRGVGSEFAQDFYADEFTISLDEDAEDTIWTIELRPGAVMQYILRREGTDRRFRAVFDLSRGRPAPTVPSLR